jgi:hypothetical protein
VFFAQRRGNLLAFTGCTQNIQGSPHLPPYQPTPCQHSNAAILAAIADKENAVVSINAAGIIQMANKSAQKLLGGLRVLMVLFGG